MLIYLADLTHTGQIVASNTFPLGVGLIGGLAGGVGAMLSDQPGSLGLVLTAALMAVALAAALAACVWGWRGIDEAAREAHKWAWWWGGSGGMAVGGVVLLSLMARDDATPLPAGIGPDAGDVFVAGMLAVLLFQLAGYVIAWAGWWLKHR